MAKVSRMAFMVLALVVVAALTGCNGVAQQFEKIGGDLKQGALKMDQYLEWYEQTGRRLVADPASVPEKDKADFLRVGSSLRKTSFGMNVLLGNYSINDWDFGIGDLKKKPATIDPNPVPVKGGDKQ